MPLSHGCHDSLMPNGEPPRRDRPEPPKKRRRCSSRSTRHWSEPSADRISTGSRPQAPVDHPSGTSARARADTRGSSRSSAGRNDRRGCLRTSDLRRACRERLPVESDQSRAAATRCCGSRHGCYARRPHEDHRPVRTVTDGVCDTHIGTRTCAGAARVTALGHI
jgi:hypothetical protein